MQVRRMCSDKSYFFYRDYDADKASLRGTTVTVKIWMPHVLVFVLKTSTNEQLLMLPLLLANASLLVSVVYRQTNRNFCFSTKQNDCSAERIIFFDLWFVWRGRYQTAVKSNKYYINNTKRNFPDIFYRLLSYIVAPWFEKVFSNFNANSKAHILLAFVTVIYYKYLYFLSNDIIKIIKVSS